MSRTSSAGRWSVALTAAGLVAGSAAQAFPPVPRPTDPWWAPPAPERCPPEAAREPVIQLAILLDTSGSMDGLINQARSRIWDVVNDLNKARRDGQRARLEVALYQYGSDRLPSSEGFLTLVQPFTTDLDLLSERLFSLRVDGSSEYCGWALRSAVDQLGWDATPVSAPLHVQPLRVIVIAGNEPFTQGPVEYHGPVHEARHRGIIVNTVYCGEVREGAESGWSDAAACGTGAFLAIDQDRPIRPIRCPQDDELFSLNNSLNSTYVAYGELGRAFQSRQAAQDDANRALSPAAAASRAAVKASEAYSNAHWDLVDAVKQKKVDLESAASSSLPESMRGMTIEERKQEIQRLQAERDRIKERIRVLAGERERFLGEQRGHGHQLPDTLDSAMIRAMREQARRLGFRFEPD